MSASAALPADTPSAAAQAGARLPSLDTLRGLIMALMALDHASAFIAHRHSSEFWSGDITRYDSALPFLVRFVTHLCAPGFFFLMGCGMALLSASRREQGWSHGRIAGFYLKRGLLLVGINQFIENPAWLLGFAFRISGGSGAPEAMPGGGFGPFLVTGVLTGLGLSLAVGGCLLRFGTRVWAAIAVAALLATEFLIPPPEQARTLFHPLWRLLLVPGHTNVLLVLYPLIPWFALAALGVVFGRWIRRDSDAALRAAPWIGLALLVTALGLRAFSGFGSIILPRDDSWIEFLNLVKYPPALVFSFFTLGVNLVILGALARVRPLAGLLAPLAVFGRTPLFFYIAHLYLYALLGARFFRRAPSDLFLPAQYAILMTVWLMGLVPLWLMCLGYRRFKESRSPDSFWRFL